MDNENSLQVKIPHKRVSLLGLAIREVRHHYSKSFGFTVIFVGVSGEGAGLDGSGVFFINILRARFARFSKFGTITALTARTNMERPIALTLPY